MSGRSTPPAARSRTSNSASPAKTRTCFLPTTGLDNAAHLAVCRTLYTRITEIPHKHTHTHWTQWGRSVNPVKSAIWFETFIILSVKTFKRFCGNKDGRSFWFQSSLEKVFIQQYNISILANCVPFLWSAL